MGGKVLELESERLIRLGKEEGKAEEFIKNIDFLVLLCYILINTKVFLFWINFGGIMKKGSEKKVTKLEKDIKKDVKLPDKKKKHYVAEKNVKVIKEKKENIFKRIGKYFKGVSKEIKRIKWTERKDLLKYTLCTLGFVFFFGVYFYAIDWVVLLVRSLAN